MVSHFKEIYTSEIETELEYRTNWFRIYQNSYNIISSQLKTNRKIIQIPLKNNKMDKMIRSKAENLIKELTLLIKKTSQEITILNSFLLDNSLMFTSTFTPYQETLDELMVNASNDAELMHIASTSKDQIRKYQTYANILHNICYSFNY
jgi:hypothetical protein